MVAKVPAVVGTPLRRAKCKARAWAILYCNWKLEIHARFPPQQPFSSIVIISDKLFGDWPLSSFTFDTYLGTS